MAQKALFLCFSCALLNLWTLVYCVHVRETWNLRVVVKSPINKTINCTCSSHDFGGAVYNRIRRISIAPHRGYKVYKYDLISDGCTVQGRGLHCMHACLQKFGRSLDCTHFYAIKCRGAAGVVVTEGKNDRTPCETPNKDNMTCICTL